MDYKEFLERKKIRVMGSGFESDYVNEKLFGWQTDIVRWCLRKGKSAIFSDCGSGKTAMQLEWAAEVSEHCQMPVLILAPLSVGRQTQREGVKFGIHVTVCRTQADVQGGVNITNYEMIEHFDSSAFCGIVLDESSILKHQDSKTRQYLTDAFADTPYKLCCTATPSPNDFMELGQHSQFLGVMTHTEMLATFFIHDGERKLDVPGIFVFVGRTVNNGSLIQEDGSSICELVQSGEVKVDLKMRTNVPGLFAAGDVRGEAARQVVCAAADGAVAALEAISYIS